MGNVLAIVSKAQFESAARSLHKPKGFVVGDIWPVDRYLSTHRALSPLADGGSLFLVTVRPPDESLWLVAILESPRQESDGWIASDNTVAIVDISGLQGKLQFASGKGIVARPGALGMSLQTPRELSAEDVTLLRGAVVTPGTSVTVEAGSPGAVSAPTHMSPLDQTPSLAGWEPLVLSLTHDRWVAMSATEQVVLIQELARQLAPAFVAEPLEPTGPLAIGRFRHVETELVFSLLPGGRFELGFTEAEIEHLRAIAGDDQEDPEGAMLFAEELEANAVEIDVAPFLIAEEPLPSDVLSELLGQDEAISEDYCIEPSFFKKARTALTRIGLRLPSEAEWEYACRAGTRALFPGGSDVIPTEPVWPVNTFGLAMMGELPEGCADGWHPSRVRGPQDARPWSGKGGVIRGGSAMLYPWQGPDWILSLCGLRDSLASAEFFLALRPALSVAPDEVAYGEPAKAARRAAGLVRRDPPVPQSRSAADHVTDESVSATEQRPAVRSDRLPGWESVPPCIIRNMYDKHLGDLTDLARPGLSDDEAEKFVMGIHERRIERLGSYYSGETAQLIPSMLDLLSDERIPGRASLAILMIDMVLGSHVSKLPLLDGPGLKTSQVDACLEVLIGEAPRLVALLADSSPAVRAAAPLLVAPVLQNGSGVEVLTGALDAEVDTSVRASLAVGSCVAGWPLPAAERAPLRALLRGMFNASALERAAAALGLATLDGGQVSHDVLPILGELAQGPVLKAPLFRWAHGDLRGFALAAAGLVGPRALAHVTAGLLERITQLRATGKGKREAATCANHLLDLHFRYTSNPIDVSRLSDFQLELLVELSTEQNAPEARWDQRGLPVDAVERRKLVFWR